MSKESLKRLEEVTRRTFGEPVAHLEDLTRLEAEIDRLTDELATVNAVNEDFIRLIAKGTAREAAAEAREKSLRETLIDRDADTFKHLRKHRRQMARLWRSQF